MPSLAPLKSRTVLRRLGELVHRQDAAGLARLMERVGPSWSGISPESGHYFDLVHFFGSGNIDLFSLDFVLANGAPVARPDNEGKTPLDKLLEFMALHAPVERLKGRFCTQTLDHVPLVATLLVTHGHPVTRRHLASACRSGSPELVTLFLDQFPEKERFDPVDGIPLLDHLLLGFFDEEGEWAKKRNPSPHVAAFMAAVAKAKGMTLPAPEGLPSPVSSRRLEALQGLVRHPGFTGKAGLSESAIGALLERQGRPSTPALLDIRQALGDSLLEYRLEEILPLAAANPPKVRL